jgi:cation diffusion facilitator CzcD-associated flavoprotein CzcO
MITVTDRREVIIVGGGQAGLAVGYFLAQQGRPFTILDAASTPAAAWRARWDSLRLFTPVRYDSLPGRAFPGDPDAYPGRDDVVAYLIDYARDWELPVELDSAVTAVRPCDDGYLVELDDRTYEAERVVIATGPFQVPRVPELAERLDPAVVQLHSTEYRRPQDVPTGPVLVVGGGNTGFQIAEELASSHEVHLSIGSRQTPLPQRILGRDLFRYLETTGLMGKTTASRIGRRLRDRDTLIGSSPRRAPPARDPAPRSDRRRIRFRGALRRRDGPHPRRDHLGHRLRPRPLHRPRPRLRRGRRPRASAWRHDLAGLVLRRAAVAAHARLGPPGMGQGRRRARRAAHRHVPTRHADPGTGMTVPR